MERTVNTRFMKLLAALLCVSLLLSGCGPRPKPEATVLTFIEKMNAYDADGCIELLESSLAKQTKASMSLGGILASGLSGIDLDGSSMIALLPMLTGLLKLAGFGIDLPQWRFANYTTVENGDKATVTGDMYVTAGKGQEDRYKASFDLVFTKGQWRISDMK